MRKFLQTKWSKFRQAHQTEEAKIEEFWIKDRICYIKGQWPKTVHKKQDAQLVLSKKESTTTFSRPLEWLATKDTFQASFPLMDLVTNGTWAFHIVLQGERRFPLLMNNDVYAKNRNTYVLPQLREAQQLSFKREEGELRLKVSRAQLEAEVVEFSHGMRDTVSTVVAVQDQKLEGGELFLTFARRGAEQFIRFPLIPYKKERCQADVAYGQIPAEGATYWEVYVSQKIGGDVYNYRVKATALAGRLEETQREMESGNSDKAGFCTDEGEELSFFTDVDV
ncbi:hypothetical protein [Shouchella shacheensis]|uniref:hypothetical protein n=1 Tax=Shouchella shacheensis TaxID=1649580 RepID=UPI00073FCC33|nr:hypothetical protein [Shouchella shacheensis]